MRHPIAWVTVEKYVELTGGTFSAVLARTPSGEWVKSRHYKEVEGRLWISLAAAQKWMEDDPAQPRRGCAGSNGDEQGDELWTLRDIASYLGRHVETVRESMACLPSFPAAIQLPGRGSGRGKALYIAAEVREWAKSFKDRNGTPGWGNRQISRVGRDMGRERKKAPS